MRYFVLSGVKRKWVKTEDKGLKVDKRKDFLLLRDVFKNRTSVVGKR